jgi:hypothetical protein
MGNIVRDQVEASGFDVERKKNAVELRTADVTDMHDSRSRLDEEGRRDKRLEARGQASIDFLAATT